jgi:hypothetical protein
VKTVTAKPLPKELEKWRTIQRYCQTDWQLPLMQFQGHLIARLCGGNARRIAEVAMALPRDCVTYQSDMQRVKREDLDSPENVWRRGIDDCDGKARLFVAIVKAAHDGADVARPVPGWKPCEGNPAALWLSHVSAEVLLSGEWLPVELTLARARLGEKPEAVPKEIESGRWMR